MIKNASILFLFLLFSIWSALLVAQEQPSIFDEGVDTTIRPEDITQDLYLWAQNTALTFKKALEDIHGLSLHEKRTFLVEKIKESVSEAQNVRELLLMRFALNRALDLNKSFLDSPLDSNDELAVNYVLIPVIRQAIALYEREDLPYLTANLNKENQDVEIPSYAAFTKNNISYLLNISNLNPSYTGQFEILKNTIMWIANDLLRSPETKRNPVNSNLILNLKELYFKYENTPAENIDYVLNNKIRSALLKTQSTLEIEKNAKEMPPFILYKAPDHSLDSSKSPFPHQLLEKPKEPGILQRIFEERSIERNYEDKSVEHLSIGAGFAQIQAESSQGKTETRNVIHIPLNILRIKNPDKGEFYVLKSGFDITQNQEFLQQNIKLLGGHFLWKIDNSPISLGPYVNIFTFKRDELRNLEFGHWLELGLALNIQPFQNKQFFIHAKAYGLPYFGGDIQHLDLNHMNLPQDASAEWKEELKRLETEHYNAETAAIKESQAKRDSIMATGEYYIYTEFNGNQWVAHNGESYWRTYGYKVLNESDRTTLLRTDKINDFDNYGFLTLEMDAEWIKSIKKQDDLILQFGGHVTNIHIQGGYDHTLPQVHRDRYSTKATETSSFFTLQYRLYDIGRRDFMDEYNSHLFNMGPILVISYETLDNPLAKNLMSFFNPDASHMVTKTETWSMYVKFNW